MPVHDIDVPTLPLGRFLPLIGPRRFDDLQRGAEKSRALLGGRTVWNVNSTSSGGGVAEMLQVLVGYILDAGVDIRWAVIAGDAEFFATTKRIHNRIHGAPGDGGDLGPREAAHYAAVMDANAAELRRSVRPGDVVLLHDPQTAGLAKPLAELGAHVIWRCHIGLDGDNEWTSDAWTFLHPHLESSAAFVFSRAEYVPRWIDRSRVAVIPPSIDPFSPKNQDLGDETVAAILATIGVSGEGPTGPATFMRRDGTAGEVVSTASIVAAEPLGPGRLLAVQVSRWDQLKDMRGVMDGFAAHVAGRVDADLALVGPSTAGVTDDPEGAAVLEDCIAAWEQLPAEKRDRIHLISLPMDDVDENAAMVNALQRRATVVVQKSIAEGFGLTVAEGMWKARPVVASAVGGIIDQVTRGTGVLLEDAHDLDAFGASLARLLERPDQARVMGEAARHHVLENFVGDRHLLRYAALMEALIAR